MKSINNPQNLILVAELDGTVIGYVWGYIEKIKEYKTGKIQELIVTSRKRKRGIGKSLIKEMLKFFKDKNCIVSNIEVFVKNIPTLEFYENMGFRKKEYKMQLRLNKTKKFSPFS